MGDGSAQDQAAVRAQRLARDRAGRVGDEEGDRRGDVAGRQVPTDCPQRERAGWTGDWQVFAPTAAYLYDVLAFTRKWLGDVVLDQRADGCVANMSPCPPAEGFDGPLGGLHGSAGWGDAVVSAPWDLYQAHGDTSLLREMWGAMTAWVRFAAAAAAGGRHPDRAAARPDPAGYERYLWDTGFQFGEWMEPGTVIDDFPAFTRADKSEVATAYLHRSAATVVRVAEVLGRPEDQGCPYRAIAEGSLEAWRREFIRDDGTLAVQTQASHVRARVPHGSLNHYSKGAVASFLHRYVAGLRPTEPGYRAFEVRPRPGGGITWASTGHVGPFGQIDVTWRAEDGSMELDLSVPGGSTATVVMPGAEPHDVGPGRHRWTGAAATG